jgi:hypothetical protein
MSKYEVDGVIRTMNEVRAITMKDPKTEGEVPRFSRLQGSDCFKDLQTGNIMKPQGVRAGTELRSMAVRLPKRQYDFSHTHGAGSGSGSRETN